LWYCSQRKNQKSAQNPVKICAFTAFSALFQTALFAGFAFFVSRCFAAFFTEFIGLHFIFFLFAFREIIVFAFAFTTRKD
jgi:hypothetical protein